MDEFLDVSILKKIDYGDKLANLTRKTSPGSMRQSPMISPSAPEDAVEFSTPSRECQTTRNRRLEADFEVVKKTPKVSPGNWIKGS